MTLDEFRALMEANGLEPGKVYKVDATMFDVAKVDMPDTKTARMRAAAPEMHELLKEAYSACRTNHTKAACKLHLVISVLGKSEQKIRLTEERRRESRVLGIGAWVKGRLLLFDLGYFKYPLFDRINRFGGYFISRLKGLCNPVIVAENIPCRGRTCQLVGQKLRNCS